MPFFSLCTTLFNLTFKSPLICSIHDSVRGKGEKGCAYITPLSPFSLCCVNYATLYFSRIKCLTFLYLFQQYLPTMKILNLSHSHDLIETPDFSFVYNLEVLILKDCPNLVGVHESIGALEKLIELNMEDCKNVRKLPDISRLKFLEILCISGCSNLNEFPMDMRNMKSLQVFQAY